LGLGNISFLSNNLLYVLYQKNIKTLAQVRKPSEDQLLSSYWLNSIDLGLSGELAKEWEQFRCELNDSGALIHDEEDNIMWT